MLAGSGHRLPLHRDRCLGLFRQAHVEGHSDTRSPRHRFRHLSTRNGYLEKVVVDDGADAPARRVRRAGRVGEYYPEPLVDLVQIVIDGDNRDVGGKAACRDGERATTCLIVQARPGVAVHGLPVAGDIPFRDSGQFRLELSRAPLGHADVGDTEKRTAVVVADDAGGPQPYFLRRAGRLHQHHVQGLARLIYGVLQGGHGNRRGLLTGGNGDLPVGHRRVIRACDGGAVLGFPGENYVINSRCGQTYGELHDLALGRFGIAYNNGSTVVDGGEDLMSDVGLYSTCNPSNYGQINLKAQRLRSFVFRILVGRHLDGWAANIACRNDG